jgi:Uma2 family endonuclease
LGTYERLMAENRSPGMLFAYDRGTLEIMVVYKGHESPNRILTELVAAVAEETERDRNPCGRTTLLREDLAKGVEPDSWFCFGGNAAAMRDRDELDLSKDPPPDLAIEVDMTRSSLNRLPIFAALGIPEVWRYDAERVHFCQLAGQQYREIAASAALPPLTGSQALVFLTQSRKLNRIAWIRGIRECVQTNR